MSSDSKLSEPLSFTLGTGYDILSRACEVIARHCDHELIFVTCFWAESESAKLVAGLLKTLSAKALDTTSKKPISVYICFSSLSVTQKLLQTSSLAGKLYDAKSISSKLFLPEPKDIPGVHLVVKSIFVRPFSVMHSKFIVVDRKLCLLPSCNVSWENWFEGCVEIRGPVVQDFVEFWHKFWVSSTPAAVNDAAIEASVAANPTSRSAFSESTSESALPGTVVLRCGQIKATFLLGDHSSDPRFRPLCLPAPRAPLTSLNQALSNAISEAKTSIWMVTPNVTSPPVLRLLLRKLDQNCSVTIITNDRLMTLEQLITAGTTTPMCLKLLIRARTKLITHTGLSYRHRDMGRLLLGYFDMASLQSGDNRASGSFPVKSHLKLTIIDDERIFLGSGNMDRASWYTSQEIDVEFISKDMARKIREQVDIALEGRVRIVYDSQDGSNNVP